MQARRLPARRGAFWLVAGFQLFRRNPPLLTALTLTYLLLVQASVGLLPLVGPFLLLLALPAMVLVVANGSRIVEQGRGVRPDGLFAGVQGNGVMMLRLGGLHLLGALLFVGILSLIEGGGQIAGAPKVDADLMWLLGRLLLLAVPFLLAFLFAPYLTGWDQVPPLQALFYSFVASARNWRALCIYALAIVVVGVALPAAVLVLTSRLPDFAADVADIAMRMMMVFLFAPVLTASLYIGYRDIFHAPAVDDHA